MQDTTALLSGFKVYFNEDGSLSLRRDDGIVVRNFDSILGVLDYLRSNHPKGQSRMTVFGHDGRKLIESFV